MWDDYEEPDDVGTLRKLHRSRYQDFVRRHHGWYEDLLGPASTFMIWTYDAVVTVVAQLPACVHELHRFSSSYPDPQGLPE